MLSKDVHFVLTSKVSSCEDLWLARLSIASCLTLDCLSQLHEKIAVQTLFDKIRMVNLRPPELRRPPVSRDIIDVEEVTSSRRIKEKATNRSTTANKSTSNSRSTSSKLNSKPAKSTKKKGKGKYSFC